MKNKLQAAAKYIQSINSSSPQIAIILGSGLGEFVERMEDKTVISYNDIPHFHKTTVAGHKGQLVFGKISDIQIIVLQGRFHTYEGHLMDQVVFPVRLLAELGVESLILTNAAGGINLNYAAGELVVIKDHINFMGKNPLIGQNFEDGPRFPDMSEAYNPGLTECILKTGSELGTDLKTGVYVGVLGPSYETPSEIKMLRILGADMVGMSTVPETIAANHIGMKVCGISCITNMGAGIEKVKLDHNDVKEKALEVMEAFTQLLSLSIEKMVRL